MAFQTSIFRDGQWVLETVNLQAALRASAVTKCSPPPEAEIPACALLSQTVVESPIVRWVLPARLRSRDHNDIAFVGSHFVQISELQQDGQLRHVLRTSNLGARIRQAIVIGDSSEHDPDDIGMGNQGLATTRQAHHSQHHHHHASPAPSDDNLRPRVTPSPLPPQRLVCILEAGVLIFLFIKRSLEGALEFSVTRYETPASIMSFGYHLVVDPSSRYIAAASPAGVLAVFELESLSNLNVQYMRGMPLTPVRSVRVRAMQAVIHKLVFLFPRPEDHFHIILALIVVRKEGSPALVRSRLITYEWEAGDDLQPVFSPEKWGHRLPEIQGMPILLIPIRFQTAFFAISPYSIGVVRYALTGSPKFDSLPLEPWPSTPYHNGSNEPIWTAWARPFRTRKYFEKTDVIYLAREDGAVIHLEIDATEMIPSVTSGWSLQTNIDTAFTTAYDIFSDVLIIGGDSGPGGIWKLAARSEPEQVNTLPDWSPVVDIAAVDGEPADRHSVPAWATDFLMYQARRRLLMTHLRRTDELYSASGRGLRGNISQWRWGLEARIGLDMELREPVRRAWGFTMDFGRGKRLCSLLASSTSSSLLRFQRDLGDVAEVAPEQAKFDLASRTLHAIQVSDTITQVTEISINVITPTDSTRCFLGESLQSPGIVAESAFCMENIIVLHTYGPAFGPKRSQLHVLQAEGIRFSRISTWWAKGEVSCLSGFSSGEDRFVLVASMYKNIPWISIYSTSGTPIMQRQMPATQGEEGKSQSPAPLEALTSVAVFTNLSDGNVALAFGTRCGRLITAIIGAGSGDLVQCSEEDIGVARVDVCATRFRGEDSPAILICCEEHLIVMTDLSPRDGRFQKRRSVWPVDISDMSLPSPAVHSVFHLDDALTGDGHEMSLMILSGSRLLLAHVNSHEGHVPRVMPLKGTPTRLMNSTALHCLVVALLVDDKPTLAFVDPESGTDMAVAGDRSKMPREFISGLGIPGDRIFGLHEWIYSKEGKTFPFLLVTTKTGKLIVISTEKQMVPGKGARIFYWTRYKKDFGKPIYSIVCDDFGILYCVDQEVHWDVLDLAAKKLRSKFRFKLESPATALQIVQDKIFVLTTQHSLMVFDTPEDAREHAQLVHMDLISRRATHMIDIGEEFEDVGRWPLTLVSDQSGRVAGLWVPWGRPNESLQSVFEAKLPFSVRRFVKARRRRPWEVGDEGERYGTVATSDDGAELMGVGICGTMARFRLLGLDLWRVLDLIQKRAMCSGSAWLVAPRSRERGAQAGRELEPGPEPGSRPHPQRLHIDGDVLARCLEARTLQDLVGADETTATQYRRYLDALEGGRHTEGIRGRGNEAETWQGYVDLGYEILTFLVGRAGC